MACIETLDQPRLAGVELSVSKKNVFLISVIRIKGFQKLDPQLHPTLKLAAYDLYVTLCFLLWCVVEIENAAERIL